MVAECDVCFRRCKLKENATGYCRARTNKEGKITAENYGLLTSVALDPVEKKPLSLFYPGSFVLSLGSFGCNMRCPFCQNHEISQKGIPSSRWCGAADSFARYYAPEAVVALACDLQRRGNIGVAYTYNEPLVGWEYVRDVSKLSRAHRMKNIVVTNGCVSPKVLDEILPFVDAMNIDCKCFSAEHYEFLGGDFESVKKTIEICASKCHVEISALIVNDFNDSAEEIAELARWLSSVRSCDGTIPLHVGRAFPRWRMAGESPTPVAKVMELVDVARAFLPHVFPGNC